MKIKFNIAIVAGLITVLTLLASCNDEEIKKEDVPELITKAVLTFNHQGGGVPVVVTASDPDGEGVQSIQVDGEINMSSGATYLLSIALMNELAEVNSDAFDITEEVKAEGDEHMFFFEWTDGLFADPQGNGNVDNRSGAVNYEDADINGLPLGLQTRWTAGTDPGTGTFRIILKHQPGTKTADSGSTIGETDLDITFNVNLQ